MRRYYRWLERWRLRDKDREWWDRMRLFQRTLYAIPVEAGDKVDVEDIRHVLQAALPDFQQGDRLFK